MFNTENLNRQIRMLWKDTIDAGQWPSELQRVWPLQYAPIPTPSLLFVGLNPSYTLRDEAARQERPIDERNTSVLMETNDVEALCEDNVVAENPYFRPFEAFIKGTPVKHWAHVDIFAVRETNQSVVETALGLNGDWTDFAMKQWAVFMDLLEQLDPPAIVVPNAKASRILKDVLKAGDMCEQSLCHFFRLNGRDVPIFFAGMLSGQHAMDVYSKARLEYVVRKKLCSMG